MWRDDQADMQPRCVWGLGRSCDHVLLGKGATLVGKGPWLGPWVSWGNSENSQIQKNQGPGLNSPD